MVAGRRQRATEKEEDEKVLKIDEKCKKGDEKTLKGAAGAYMVVRRC